jgi:hypothetical protein
MLRRAKYCVLLFVISKGAAGLRLTVLLLRVLGEACLDDPGSILAEEKVVIPPPWVAAELRGRW